MEPTILIGDDILVKKSDNEIQRGDIVAFKAPATAPTALEKNGTQKIWIKRVLGLPGDSIEIRQKHLILNGKSLNEPYCVHKDPMTYPAALGKIRDYQSLWQSGGFAEMRREQIGDDFGPILVPKDSYFVLGDNREGSYDSRYWGPLRRELFVGKAVEIYAPLSRAREL
jgi:signal peptidase I